MVWIMMMKYIGLYLYLYVRLLHCYMSFTTGRGADEMTDQGQFEAEGLWISMSLSLCLGVVPSVGCLVRPEAETDEAS